MSTICRWSAASSTACVAYASTKRAQVVLTELWARRLAGEGIVVHAMHPGLGRHAGPAQLAAALPPGDVPMLRTAKQGADTIVWLGAAPGGRRRQRRLLARPPPASNAHPPGTTETPQSARGCGPSASA